MDHKAIVEELEYCEENKLSITSVPTSGLRQLLDENQRFEIRMVENHRQAVANAVIIDELREENTRYREALQELKHVADDDEAMYIIRTALNPKEDTNHET